MKLPKIKIKKIKNFFGKITKTLATSAFSTFFGFLLLILVLGAFIFYRYVILIKEAEPVVSESVLQFKEEIYQKILEIWEEKKKRFKEVDFKEYLNPFQKTKTESSKPSSESSPEQEKPEPEIVSGLSVEEIKTLEKATNLAQFYGIKKERLPPLSERARLWEQKGLGLAGEYIGSSYQNLKLLEELKKELTE